MRAAAVSGLIMTAQLRKELRALGNANDNRVGELVADVELHRRHDALEGDLRRLLRARQRRCDRYDLGRLQPVAENSVDDRHRIVVRDWAAVEDGKIEPTFAAGLTRLATGLVDLQGIRRALVRRRSGIDDRRPLGLSTGASDILVSERATVGIGADRAIGGSGRILGDSPVIQA